MVKSIKIRQIHKDTLCCEPLLVKGNNGDLICVCECEGPGEPHKDNREFVFRSSDNGETWSPKERMIEEVGLAEYATGIYNDGNEISVFFSIQGKGWYNPEDWKCRIVKSKDDGCTWEDSGEPPFFPMHTFIRTPITLSNGNLLIPYHTYPLNENGKFYKAESGVLKSKDNGETFEKFPACEMPMNECDDPYIWSEPTLATLSNGNIVMLLRRSGECLWRCDSSDDGETWSEMVKTDIPNPACKPKLLNLDDGKIALINMPNPKERFPLCLWISDDDMNSWSEKIELTNFPGTYHYADGFYEDGHIKFVIEHDRNRILYFDVEV